MLGSTVDTSLCVRLRRLVFLVIHLALCSFPVFRPVMLDIMASMDLKDSFMRDFPWRFHRCSSWTRLSCPLCATTCPGPAAHSGAAAGAAHHQGHLHPLRGAEFGSHGSDCSTDHEIPRLQFLDKDFTCPLLSHTGALAGPDSADSVGFRSWHCLGQVDDMPAGVSTF